MLAAFGGIPIVESRALYDIVEDWSEVRSPARARRRRNIALDAAKRAAVLAWPHPVYDGAMLYPALEAALRVYLAEIDRRSPAPAPAEGVTDEMMERAMTALKSGLIFYTPNDRELVRDVLEAAISAPSEGAGKADWRDDPSADERWNAGCDFAMTHLCKVLGVDPQAVSWDAATETLDGDVMSVIGNILRAKYGDEWSAAPSPASVRP